MTSHGTNFCLAKIHVTSISNARATAQTGLPHLTRFNLSNYLRVGAIPSDKTRDASSCRSNVSDQLGESNLAQRISGPNRPIGQARLETAIVLVPFATRISAAQRDRIRPGPGPAR